MSKSRMTRRDALLALGLLGLGTGMMGACGGTGLWILSQQRKSTPVPASPTAESTKTMTPQPGPQIVSRETWGALAPDHSARNESGFYSPTNPGGWRVYDQPLPEVYNTLVVHHSAFIEENDMATLHEIQDVHRGRNGWADVAYHYLIGRDGTIYEGRDIGAPGTWNSSESGHPYLFTDTSKSASEMWLFFQGNNDMGKSWYLSKKRVTWRDGLSVIED